MPEYVGVWRSECGLLQAVAKGMNEEWAYRSPKELRWPYLADLARDLDTVGASMITNAWSQIPHTARIPYTSNILEMILGNRSGPRINGTVLRKGLFFMLLGLAVTPSTAG